MARRSAKIHHFMEREPGVDGSRLLASGLVRIGGVGGVAGGGVLVDREHVVTCAHVVADALGAAAGPDPPHGALTLDFPLLAVPGEDPPACAAEAIEDGWRAIEDDGRGDLAILRLTKALPAAAAPPPLLRPPDLTRTLWHAYGFPTGFDGPRIAPVRSLDAVAVGGEWIQLERAQADAFAVEHGYSGGPIWDPQLGAVVGIVVAADVSRRRSGSFMIPLSVVAGAWPPLEDAIGWRLRFDDRREDHWRRAAQGVSHGTADADLFTGRGDALRDLATWIRAPDGRARLVKGRPGSGKSAVLARLVTQADPERLEKPAEDETSVPPGAVGVALVATGMTLGEARRRIGKWLGAPARSAVELVSALEGRAQERGSAPLIAIDQLDAAANPRALIVDLLVPLLRAGAARLLIGLRTADDCPFAALLEPYADPVDLDEKYFAAKDVENYVRRLLEERRADRDAARGLVEDVAKAIAGAAGISFLVAQLSALWQCDQERLVLEAADRYPRDAVGTLRFYVEGLAADEPEAAEVGDLMAALAYARGVGLPAAGPVWAAVAGAVQDRDYAVERPLWLVGTAARYLLRSEPDDGGRACHRLVHAALEEALHDPSARDAIERRIVARLGALYDATRREPADRYVEVHLAAHVAAASAWQELADQPHLLDRLEPWTVRAEVLPAALQRDVLPDEIAGVIRSVSLAERGSRRDRPGLRLLGMARAANGRAFGDDDVSLPLAAWRLRSAVLRQHPPHVLLDAVAEVHALATFTGPAGVSLLAAGCADGATRIWDAATGQPFGDTLVAPGAGARSAVRALAVHDGDGILRLLAGHDDGRVRIWDLLAPGAPAEIDAGHARGVWSLAAFAHGGELYAVTGGAEPEARLWSADGRLRATLADHGAVRAVAAMRTAQATRVLGGGDDGGVRIWDLGAEALDGGGDGPLEPARTLAGPRDWIRALCVMQPDGADPSVGAVGDDPRLAIWHLADRGDAAESAAAHRGPVLGVAAYAVDGGAVRIATGGDDAEVRIWDAGAVAVGRPLTGHDRAVQAVSAYDGALGAHIVTGGSDRTVRIWDASLAEQPAPVLDGHEHPVLSVAATSDGLLVTGDEGGIVCAWETATGHRRSHPIAAGVGAVRALAVLPGDAVIAAGDEGVACIPTLSPEAGAQVVSWGRSRAGVVRTVLGGLTLDGTDVVATGGDDGVVRLWGAHDGAELTAAPTARPKGPVRSLAAVVRRDGSRVLAVAGTGRELHLRSLDGRTVGKPLAGHRDWPMAVCAYPADGGWQLVSGADDLTVRSWNPDTQEPFGAIGAHDGPIRALAAFEHGGRPVVASGGDDQTLRVWDPGRRSPLLWRIELGVRVNAICPVADALAIGTDDGHVVVRLLEPAT